MLLESFDDYKQKIKLLPKSCFETIYNIVDGKKHRNKVIYNHKKFLIIPEEWWVDHKDSTSLQVLAIVKDKRLRTMRDLEQYDIPLLQDIQTIGSKIICDKYKLNPSDIVMFFHYPPSEYLLHVHIEHKSVYHNSKTLKRHISVTDVINNISSDSDYYRGILEIVVVKPKKQRKQKINY
jgi:m7GpppX diphosphatase